MLYDLANKYVFSLFLNTVNDEDCIISRGSLFQSLGALHWNARDPFAELGIYDISDGALLPLILL